MRILKLTTLLLCIGAFAFAQDTRKNFSTQENEKDWGFSITPYALLAAQSTDVGGEKIRQSFSDLSSMTNAGFQIVGAVRYKKLTATFDGTFATLGAKESVGPLDVDLTIQQKIFDIKAAYTLYDNYEFGADEVLKGWSLDFAIGGKYWLNDVDVNYKLVINDTPILDDKSNTGLEWWDLMVGFRTRFAISPKFLLSVAYNAGGFGIGKSSKFSHDFSYVNSFKVSKIVLVNAGFRGFHYERNDDGVETKVNVLGPLLGATIMF